MKAVTDFTMAYKFVWLRVLGYFVIPSATLFLTQTETLSDEGWTNMGTFLRGRLFLQCFVAGFTAFMAYIDKSLQNARENYKQRTGDTEFVTKPKPTTND